MVTVTLAVSVFVLIIVVMMQMIMISKGREARYTTRSEEPRQKRKYTKRKQKKSRISEAMKKRWALCTPEKRKIWIASAQRGREISRMKKQTAFLNNT